MAIVGRDLDVSERKVAFNYQSRYNGLSTATANDAIIGVSRLINMFMIPFSGTIVNGYVTGTGVSGAPNLTLVVNRFIAGATTWSFASMAVTTFGTSGVMPFSGMLAAGNTLLQVLPGDLIQVVTSVANTAITELMVELIVKKTADIVAYNNVST